MAQPLVFSFLLLPSLYALVILEMEREDKMPSTSIPTERKSLLDGLEIGKRMKRQEVESADYNQDLNRSVTSYFPCLLRRMVTDFQKSLNIESSLLI